MPKEVICPKCAHRFDPLATTFTERMPPPVVNLKYGKTAQAVADESAAPNPKAAKRPKGSEPKE